MRLSFRVFGDLDLKNPDVKRKCELKQKTQKPTKHRMTKPVKSRELQNNTQLESKYNTVFERKKIIDQNKVMVECLPSLEI